eukprot:7815686-Pyramimonas_sp.AAC.1
MKYLLPDNTLRAKRGSGTVKNKNGREIIYTEWTCPEGLCRILEASIPVLRSISQAQSPNATSPLGVGGLTSFLFHPSFFPFGE